LFTQISGNPEGDVFTGGNGFYHGCGAIYHVTSAVDALTLDLESRAISHRDDEQIEGTEHLRGALFVPDQRGMEAFARGQIHLSELETNCAACFVYHLADAAAMAEVHIVLDQNLFFLGGQGHFGEGFQRDHFHMRGSRLRNR